MVKIQYEGFPEFGMDGYLHANLKDARDIVENKNQSLIIINDGKTGLGKTTLSFQEAVFLSRGDPTKFNLNHVLFDPEPSFEKVANSEKGCVWIFDESVIFNSRSAMSQYNKSMLLLLSTIRSKQIYVILNIPSFFDLDRGITMDKANVLIHLYGNHFGDRGKFMVFDDKRMKNLFLFGKKTYSYGGVKSNFFGSFGAKFMLDSFLYDELKKREIKKILVGQIKEGSNKIRTQRDFLVSYLTQKMDMVYKEVSDLFPSEIVLSASTISDGISRIRKRYNPFWFKRRLLEEEIPDSVSPTLLP